MAVFLDSLVDVYEVDVASGPKSTWVLPVPGTAGPLAAGDMLLFDFCFDTTTTAPSFTAVPADVVELIPATMISDPAIAGRTLGYALYYKIVTAAEAASPPSSYSFVLNTAFDGTLSTSRFRGANPADIFASPLAQTTHTSSSNTSKTAPAATTDEANTLAITGVHHRSGSSTLTAGDPVGYTTQTEAFGIGGRGHAVAYKTVSAAGSTGTAVWRQSSGGIGHTWQIALTSTGAAATVPSVTHRVVSEVTSNTALVNVKVVDTSSVRLKCGTNAALTTGVVYGASATPDAQGLAFLPVTGLAPNNVPYFYRVAMIDSAGNEVLDNEAVQGRFKTDGVGPVSFCFSSCNDTSDPDTFNAIAAWDDDLFLHIGDFYYDDGSGTGLANIQSHMDAKLRAPKQAGVYSTRVTGMTPSDHDGMNNNTTGGSHPTAWANWNTAYRARFMPASRLPSNGVYRTFTKGAGLVRFIVMDTRSFKSASSAVDDASKTALGSVQKKWVKDTVTAAAEPIIILVNADPFIGSDPGHDSWLGYTTERNEMAAFFKASGKNLIMTGGDMHALAVDDGRNNPGAFPVLHAAPLYNSASIKGGPYSGGTYPTTEGATVQQYGRVVITPGSGTVTVDYKGYSQPTTQRLSFNRTYQVSGLPAPLQTVRDRWDGTTLVRQRRDRWSGTALVQQTITK